MQVAMIDAKFRENKLNINNEKSSEVNTEKYSSGMRSLWHIYQRFRMYKLRQEAFWNLRHIYRCQSVRTKSSKSS